MYFCVLIVFFFLQEAKALSCKSLPVGVASVAKIPNSDMTSSTKYSTSTPASNGRLNYTAGSSWCAATSDSSPHLQINLGSSYVICGVATQGDHKSDQWVQTYQIQTSTDGTIFTDYKQNNFVKEFGGNVDSNTIVQNLLFDGTVGQYIRIKPKSNYGSTSCMRTELYGVQQNTVCSNMSTGIPYSSLVPNHRFNASSYFDNRYLPRNARLRYSKAWEPKTGKEGIDWLQIDLGPVVYVCAVATQGNAYVTQEWATKYKLRVSLNNINWEYYQENNNVDKEFTGNKDKPSIVTNALNVPIKAKFIKFYPTEHNGFAAMRVDVYGVPAACGSPFGLEKDGSIQNNKLTSSSVLDNSHSATHGRLYGDASWCSLASSNTEYIQIDLGKMVTLTGIATQGDHTMDKWVKTYTLKYSIDGSHLNEYRGGQSTSKVFQGNVDKSSIAVRWLTHPVTVKYVRVHPQSWKTDICMRIELFGCTCPSPPDITELSNKNLTTRSGSHVDLSCKVQEPLIQKIDWYSDGNDITSLSGGITRGANFVKSVLRVNYTNVAICTTYACSKEASYLVCRRNIVCRAKYANVNGNTDSIRGAEIKVKLQYTSAPTQNPPDNIQSNSVKVHWTHSITQSQARVEEFLIRYWNHQTSKTVNVSHPATSHTITGLSACTRYSVAIRAVSKCDDGPWSSEQSFVTAIGLPNVAPAVTAKAKSSQNISVTWQVPVGISCPPNGHKVIYSLTSGGDLKEVDINDGQITSYTLTKLTKYTEYDISVKIRNEKGYGPASTVITRRTMEDKPDAAPLHFKATAASSTSVNLSWNLPPADKRNGIITGFRVWYCKKTNSGCESSKVLTMSGSGILQRTLDSLKRYTEYSFKVLAYTTIGDGPYTNEETERTLEGSPSEPQNVTPLVDDPVGSSGPQIKLSWSPPAHPYGIIKGYKVSLSKTGDFNVTLRTLGKDARSTSFSVCGEHKYDLVLWAFNTKDGMKARNTIDVGIFVPLMISQPKFSERNATTFMLSWLPVPSTNGRILVYEVDQSHIKNSLDAESKKMNVSSCNAVPCYDSPKDYCSLALYNLQQCSEYKISVRAYTAAGAGPRSKHVILQTSTPGAPRKLITTHIDKKTVHLKWQHPEKVAEQVQKYTVVYIGKK